MIELIKRGLTVSIVAEKPYLHSSVVSVFKITQHKTMKVLFESKKLLKALREYKEIESGTKKII